MSRRGGRESVRHFGKYLVVGVANTAVYYGSFLALQLVLAYFAAHVVAFAVATVNSFFLNALWTFRVRPTWRRFLAFPLTNVVNFAATSVGVVTLVEWIGVPQALAPIIAAGLAIPVTFALTRYVLLGAGWASSAREGDGSSPSRPTASPDTRTTA